MALKGVLLDIDGTLVLSNDAHAQAWVDAFATGGYDDVTFEQVRPLIGMGGDHLMPKVVPGLSSKEGQGKIIARYRTQIFLEEYAPHLEAAPGSRELVQKLKEAGLKVVVASSAKEKELEALLKAARVHDLIEAAVTSSDAESSKPSPDIVAAALEKENLQPDQVLMLGDTPYDVESAGKVNVKVVALRCGGFSDEQLQGAIAIYNDPADLLRQYDISPLSKLVVTA